MSAGTGARAGRALRRAQLPTARTTGPMAFNRDGIVHSGSHLRGWVSMRPVALARRAAVRAWDDRVLGLAAEAGFWQLLSLPSLLLAILGMIGYVGDAMGADAVDRVRGSLLQGASRLLTDEVVTDVVGPTIDKILAQGRLDVISIGFVLSLWTGSTAMSTFVNTITIAYGQREQRSAVRSRLLALRMFLLQVLSGVVLLPALVLGPGLLSNLLHANRYHLVALLIRILYWPAVALISLAMLTTLYHLSLPDRRPWFRALPGAVLALVVWLVGSYLLRLYLGLAFGNELVYGSLGAPVAALLFFYITALAVLLGAELNAVLDAASGRGHPDAELVPGTGGAADTDEPADTEPAGTRHPAQAREPADTGTADAEAAETKAADTELLDTGTADTDEPADTEPAGTRHPAQARAVADTRPQ